MELIVFGIILLLGISNSQIILEGQCDESIQVAEKFIINDFLGIWNVIETLTAVSPQSTCSRFEWSRDDTSGLYVVNNTQVNERRFEEVFKGHVTDASTANLLIDLIDPGETTPNSMPYWILTTDHSSYALAYSCSNIGTNFRRVSSWKLSKSWELSIEAEDVINSIINNIESLYPNYYHSVEQSHLGCFYFLEADENEPINLPGQCEDVVGMKDFRMDLYLGWWHQIESYPTGEAGTCRNSKYTSNGDQFQVVDTVMNDNIPQYNQYIITVTTDGKLTKTFEDSEETWMVLGTDYINYSLVYKCENIEGGYRRVWSAKHSKNGALTPASESAMRNIMESISVLDPRFYVKDDQSIDSCFYFPPKDSKPVILRGQCDRTTPVFRDLNVKAFSGTWYYTEKYPEDWEENICPGIKFTERSTPETIDIQEWHVANENDDEVDAIEGFLTDLNWRDNEARFMMSLPTRNSEENANATRIVSSYDVLATDYSTYAVTYRCEQLNEFQRRITVWKLSRERTMPNASVIDIDETINKRREINAEYFVPQTQNDDCPSSSLLLMSSVPVILVSGILQLLL